MPASAFPLTRADAAIGDKGLESARGGRLARGTAGGSRSWDAAVSWSRRPHTHSLPRRSHWATGADGASSLAPGAGDCAGAFGGVMLASGMIWAKRA